LTTTKNIRNKAFERRYSIRMLLPTPRHQTHGSSPARAAGSP
jgi:hypothetical protein